MRTITIFKKITAILCLSILVYACISEPSFTISGTVELPEMEGKQVVLSKTIGGIQISDTTTVVGGAYRFKGYVEEPVYSRITINGEERQNRVSLGLIVENEIIGVTTDSKKRSRVGGSTHNDILQQFIDGEQALFQKRDEAFPILSNGWINPTPEQLEALSSELFAKLTNDIRLFDVEFIKNNINNPAGQTQVPKIIGFSHELLREAFSNINEKSLENPEVARVAARLQALDNTAIGLPFTDLCMFDPKGKEMSISDYVGKGKYVFIDFWASWCAPCRAEKPHEIAAYNKYKNKGFEIIGVSLDNNHEAWTTAIKELGLTWPQMSDMKGGQSEAYKLYGIVGIPHSVLLNKEGIIIAKELRGGALEKKLDELIK